MRLSLALLALIVSVIPLHAESLFRSKLPLAQTPIHKVQATSCSGPKPPDQSHDCPVVCICSSNGSNCSWTLTCR